MADRDVEKGQDFMCRELPEIFNYKTGLQDGESCLVSELPSTSKNELSSADGKLEIYQRLPWQQEISKQDLVESEKSAEEMSDYDDLESDETASIESNLKWEDKNDDEGRGDACSSAPDDPVQSPSYQEATLPSTDHMTPHAFDLLQLDRKLVKVFPQANLILSPMQSRRATFQIYNIYRKELNYIVVVSCPGSVSIHPCAGHLIPGQYDEVTLTLDESATVIDLQHSVTIQAVLELPDDTDECFMEEARLPLWLRPSGSHNDHQAVSEELGMASINPNDAPANQSLEQEQNLPLDLLSNWSDDSSSDFGLLSVADESSGDSDLDTVKQPEDGCRDGDEGADGGSAHGQDLGGDQTAGQSTGGGWWTGRESADGGSTDGQSITDSEKLQMNSLDGFASDEAETEEEVDKPFLSEKKLTKVLDDGQLDENSALDYAGKWSDNAFMHTAEWSVEDVYNASNSNALLGDNNNANPGVSGHSRKLKSRQRTPGTTGGTENVAESETQSARRGRLVDGSSSKSKIQVAEEQTGAGPSSQTTETAGHRQRQVAKDGEPHRGKQAAMDDASTSSQRVANGQASRRTQLESSADETIVDMHSEFADITGGSKQAQRLAPGQRTTAVASAPSVASNIPYIELEAPSPPGPSMAAQANRKRRIDTVETPVKPRRVKGPNYEAGMLSPKWKSKHDMEKPDRRSRRRSKTQGSSLSVNTMSSGRLEETQKKQAEDKGKQEVASRAKAEEKNERQEPARKIKVDENEKQEATQRTRKVETDLKGKQELTARSRLEDNRHMQMFYSMTEQDKVDDYSQRSRMEEKKRQEAAFRSVFYGQHYHQESSMEEAYSRQDHPQMALRQGGMGMQPIVAHKARVKLGQPYDTEVLSDRSTSDRSRRSQEEGHVHHQSYLPSDRMFEYSEVRRAHEERASLQQPTRVSQDQSSERGSVSKNSSTSAFSQVQAPPTTIDIGFLQNHHGSLQLTFLVNDSTLPVADYLNIENSRNLSVVYKISAEPPEAFYFPISIGLLTPGEATELAVLFTADRAKHWAAENVAVKLQAAEVHNSMAPLLSESFALRRPVPQIENLYFTSVRIPCVAQDLSTILASSTKLVQPSRSSSLQRSASPHSIDRSVSPRQRVEQPGVSQASDLMPRAVAGRSRAERNQLPVEVTPELKQALQDVAAKPSKRPVSRERRQKAEEEAARGGAGRSRVDPSPAVLELTPELQRRLEEENAQGTRRGVMWLGRDSSAQQEAASTSSGVHPHLVSSFTGGPPTSLPWPTSNTLYESFPSHSKLTPHHRSPILSDSSISLPNMDRPSNQLKSYRSRSVSGNEADVKGLVGARLKLLPSESDIDLRSSEESLDPANKPDRLSARSASMTSVGTFDDESGLHKKFNFQHVWEADVPLSDNGVRLLRVRPAEILVFDLKSRTSDQLHVAQIRLISQHTKPVVFQVLALPRGHYELYPEYGQLAPATECSINVFLRGGFYSVSHDFIEIRALESSALHRDPRKKIRVFQRTRLLCLLEESPTESHHSLHLRSAQRSRSQEARESRSLVHDVERFSLPTPRRAEQGTEQGQAQQAAGQYMPSQTPSYSYGWSETDIVDPFKKNMQNLPTGLLKFDAYSAEVSREPSGVLQESEISLHPEPGGSSPVTPIALEPKFSFFPGSSNENQFAEPANAMRKLAKLPVIIEASTSRMNSDDEVTRKSAVLGTIPQFSEAGSTKDPKNNLLTTDPIGQPWNGSVNQARTTNQPRTMPANQARTTNQPRTMPANQASTMNQPTTIPANESGTMSQLVTSQVESAQVNTPALNNQSAVGSTGGFVNIGPDNYLVFNGLGAPEYDTIFVYNIAVRQLAFQVSGLGQTDLTFEPTLALVEPYSLSKVKVMTSNSMPVTEQFVDVRAVQLDRTVDNVEWAVNPDRVQWFESCWRMAADNKKARHVIRCLKLSTLQDASPVISHPNLPVQRDPSKINLLQLDRSTRGSHWTTPSASPSYKFPSSVGLVSPPGGGSPLNSARTPGGGVAKQTARVLPASPRNPITNPFRAPHHMVLISPRTDDGSTQEGHKAQGGGQERDKSSVHDEEVVQYARDIIRQMLRQSSDKLDELSSVDSSVSVDIEESIYPQEPGFTQGELVYGQEGLRYPQDGYYDDQLSEVSMSEVYRMAMWPDGSVAGEDWGPPAATADASAVFLPQVLSTLFDSVQSFSNILTQLGRIGQRVRKDAGEAHEIQEVRKNLLNLLEVTNTQEKQLQNLKDEHKLVELGLQQLQSSGDSEVRDAQSLARKLKDHVTRLQRDIKQKESELVEVERSTQLEKTAAYYGQLQATIMETGRYFENLKQSPSSDRNQSRHTRSATSRSGTSSTTDRSKTEPSSRTNTGSTADTDTSSSDSQIISKWSYIPRQTYPEDEEYSDIYYSNTSLAQRLNAFHYVQTVIIVVVVAVTTVLLTFVLLKR